MGRKNGEGEGEETGEGVVGRVRERGPTNNHRRPSLGTNSVGTHSIGMEPLDLLQIRIVSAGCTGHSERRREERERESGGERVCVCGRGAEAKKNAESGKHERIREVERGRNSKEEGAGAQPHHQPTHDPLSVP